MRRPLLVVLALSLAGTSAAWAQDHGHQNLSEVEEILSGVAERTDALTVLAEPDAYGAATALVNAHPEWNATVRWSPEGMSAAEIARASACTVGLSRTDGAWEVATAPTCIALTRKPLSMKRVEQVFSHLADRPAVLVVADEASAGLADALRAQARTTDWVVMRGLPAADPIESLKIATASTERTCGVWLRLLQEGWEVRVLKGCADPDETDAVADASEPPEETQAGGSSAGETSTAPEPTATTEPTATAEAAPAMHTETSAAIERAAVEETEREPAVAIASAEPTEAPSPQPEPTPQGEPQPTPRAETRPAAAEQRLVHIDPRATPWSFSTSTPSEASRLGMVMFGGAYGAYVGGNAAYLIGEATEGREDDYSGGTILPGAVAGGVAGAGLALVIAGPREFEPEAVALTYGGTALGAYYGTQLGRLFIHPDSAGQIERVQAANLGGSLIGFGIGTAMSHRARPVPDQVHTYAATGLGWIVGTGANDLSPLDAYDERQGRAAVAMGSAAAFGGLAMGYNHTRLPHPQAGVLTLYGGTGAWLGGWAPSAVWESPSLAQTSGGIRAGLGAGYVGALAVTAAGGTSPRSIGLQSAGLVAGSALGAGIPLSSSPTGSVQVVPASLMAGAVLGQVGGALLSPAYTGLDLGHGTTAATFGAWSVYNTVGWALFGQHLTNKPTQTVGFGLAAAGGGALLTLTATPFVPFSPQDAVFTLSMGGWGTWFGAWSASLAHMNPQEQWGVTLGAGNAALVGGAVLSAATRGPSWEQIGWVDGMGLAGAAAGGLVGAVALYDPQSWDPLVASTLIGSAVGVGTGTTVAMLRPSARPASAMHWTPRLPHLNLPGMRGRHLRPTMQALPIGMEPEEQGLLLRLDLYEVMDR